jgi:hypothetical protein
VFPLPTFPYSSGQCFIPCACFFDWILHDNFR